MSAPHVPLILLWDTLWLDLAEAATATAGLCDLSSDRGDYSHADAVIFPMPATARQVPARRAFANQVWVLWSQESAVHYPQLDDRVFCRAFDIHMTYRWTSDIPIPYPSPSVFDVLEPLVPLGDRSDTLVSAWISSGHDRCGRDEYLRELMRCIPVHSFGKVARNITLPADEGFATKLATIRRYRFTVAFENSIDTDYVTEKLFQPLRMGSVPIYRGAPNAERFAPAPHSFVNADEFENPAQLAEFLTEMSDDDYLRYHEWRTSGPTAEWRLRFAPFEEHAMARLARAVPVVSIGLSAAAARDRVASRPPCSPPPGRLPSASDK